jgi:hypothetical protein
MDDLEAKLKLLDEKYSLIPFTDSSRVYSTVRRMKMEKELGIPIEYRGRSAISVASGKRTNEMAEQEWEDFFAAMSNSLKRYPSLYARLFPDAAPAAPSDAGDP